MMQMCLGVRPGNEAVPPAPSNSGLCTGADIQPVTSPASAEGPLQDFLRQREPWLQPINLFTCIVDSVLLQNHIVVPFADDSGVHTGTQCWAAKPSLLTSQFPCRHTWDQGKWRQDLRQHHIRTHTVIWGPSCFVQANKCNMIKRCKSITSKCECQKTWDQPRSSREEMHHPFCSLLSPNPVSVGPKAGVHAV